MGPLLGGRDALASARPWAARPRSASARATCTSSVLEGAASRARQEGAAARRRNTAETAAATDGRGVGVRHMGQKDHIPIGFRVGITRRHDSRWYAAQEGLPEACSSRIFEIRKHIKKEFYGAQIPRIEIDRSREAGPDPRALREAGCADRPQGREGGPAPPRIFRQHGRDAKMQASTSSRSASRSSKGRSWRSRFRRSARAPHAVPPHVEEACWSSAASAAPRA